MTDKERMKKLQAEAHAGHRYEWLAYHSFLQAWYEKGDLIWSEDAQAAIAAAYEAGANDVHNTWVMYSDRGEGPPKGDPEFGEAASDYAEDAQAALDKLIAEAVKAEREALIETVERELRFRGFSALIDWITKAIRNRSETDD